MAKQEKTGQNRVIWPQKGQYTPTLDMFSTIFAIKAYI
jgi:hypothetical protein